MTVYILDQDPSEEPRSWSDMIADVVELSLVSDDEQWSQRPPPGSIMICHQVDDASRDAIRKLSASGVFVVFVSASGGSGREESHNEYHRRTPVAKPSDDAFARLFERFRIVSESSGRPMWKVMEPAPWPENLVAVYILVRALLAHSTEVEDALVAEFSKPSEEWRNTLWDSAGIEFRESGGDPRAWRQIRKTMEAWLRGDQSLAVARGDLEVIGNQIQRVFSGSTTTAGPQ